MRQLMVFLVWIAAIPVQGTQLETPWERDPEATPRYDETVAWCAELAATHATVAMTSFGTSPEGRSLPLVIWDAQGLAAAAAVQAAGRTVLLVQACIHAGESCGKDAGMVLLRDLAEQGGPGDVTVLFIPIFNVDGHERFGPYHRVNQNGPREMGWRVTAQNLNLNRDFLKADAPEMRAWLAMWNGWRPHLLVDIHSTDGADYQYVITYGLERQGNLDEGVRRWQEPWFAALDSAMTADGYPLAPYVSFRDWHDPRSGLRGWVAGPRFSQGYAAVRNRPGLLVEAHMLKPYPQRVRATRALLGHVVASLADQRPGHGHGSGHLTLQRATEAADLRTAAMAGRGLALPVRWEDSEASRPFRFLGVAYEETVSALSGGEYIVYHPERPDTFEIDYHDQPRVAARVTIPAAYLVPPAWAAVADRLRMHGVVLERLTAPVTMTVDGWRLEDCAWQARPYEGRHPVTYRAVPVTETRTFPAGTWVVDNAQASARAVVHLLDPEGPDALLHWGFFDPILTRVEYVERYVIERLMTEMVAADPALADSLQARKDRDPEFATNPRAIRDWFYRRTPYHDQRAFLYPIGVVRNPSHVNGLPKASEF